MKKTLQMTDEWTLYEKGKEYNYSLDLYNVVNTNERFYRGDQWEGITSNGLPKPVFNIFKRVINYYTSNLLSSAVKMRFSCASPFGGESGMTGEDAQNYSMLLNNICEKQWEKLKTDNLLADSLTEAAVTGDAVLYTYWDSSARTGQSFKGDFKTIQVDNTNVFFGNPNSRDIQKQPYILISSREEINELKKSAKQNGRSPEEIEKIVSDNEINEQSGVLSKKELAHTRCIALIKLWRGDDGKIMYRKSVKNAVICDTVNTGLSLYPVCLLNWTKSKNSWHGEAVATGLIENQIFINKGYAMVMKHMMDTAFSKVVYDGTLIEEWSNRIGEAIRVDGPVENVAKILSPGQMQTGILDVLNLAMRNTKECLGATDTALGDVKPNNTSAILALQQASVMPLENIKRQYYQFIEDLGLVWLDFILCYYDDKRLVRVPGKEGDKFIAFDFKNAREAIFDCKIDVGAVNYWSEISCLNTLDSLLLHGKITTQQYLKRLPDNLISAKDELINELDQIESVIQNEKGVVR